MYEFFYFLTLLVYATYVHQKLICIGYIPLFYFIDIFHFLMYVWVKKHILYKDITSITNIYFIS
jgi:hypothetical protein